MAGAPRQSSANCAPRSPQPCWDPPRTRPCSLGTCHPCSSTSRARALCGVRGSGMGTGPAPRAVPGAGVSAANLSHSLPVLPQSPGPPQDFGTHPGAPQCPGDPNPPGPPDRAGAQPAGSPEPSANLEPSGAASTGLRGQEQHGQSRDVSGKGAPHTPCKPRTTLTPRTPGQGAGQRARSCGDPAGCQGSGSRLWKVKSRFGRRQSSCAGSGGAGRAGAAAGLAAR